MKSWKTLKGEKLCLLAGPQVIFGSLSHIAWNLSNVKKAEGANQSFTYQ